MSLKVIFYAYVLGGITFIPLVIFGLICYTIYTSVPVGDLDPAKSATANLEKRSVEDAEGEIGPTEVTTTGTPDVNDLPRPRKGWLTVRRTYKETPTDASYVGFVRGFLDARSKDPKRSRPKDMWYVALKGKVLYLYEDESMTDCEAAIELSGHQVIIYPEGLLDGELFAKRNAVCLKPRTSSPEVELPSLTREMQYADETREEAEKEVEGATTSKQKARAERLQEVDKKREEAKAEALEISTPWFIFVRSNVEMEDWYLALIHASAHPPNTSTLSPLEAVFRPSDMDHLVSTIDEQPDVIPMRWLNALLGRLFFSFYRTQHLESYIIGRLMRKLAKIKRPSFLTHIVVREVSVGNTAPSFSKPMLKELTKEGDAALEVHMSYKGEVRVTIEAVATINLGARFKSYAVKLVLAVVLRELEGNLLVKVKRPPSNRIWYAFTTMPRMVLDVEPVVSDRQITWSMILSTIESKLKEVIQESVVLPNMDDIAFFESSQCAHRGGIWSDAARQERSSTLFPTPAPVVTDDKSIASEPSLQTQTAPASFSATPEPILSLQRSHSAEETQAEVIGVAMSEQQEGQPTLRSTVPSSLSFNGSTSSRRRTWFGGSWNDEPSSVESLNDPDEAVARGRQGRAEVSVSRGSSSTRSSHSASGGEVTLVAPDDENNTHLKPIAAQQTPSRRSHSHSFSFQNYGAQPTEGLSTSAPGESSMPSSRPQSPPQLGSSGAERNAPVSPTFFQTLKSRDKQAISNTAKEAMRKWGVNWGSLKKGNDAVNSSGTAGEFSSDGNSLDAPDSVKAHKPRPSYAEVRAAVEQRKEREKPHVEPIAVSQFDQDGSSQDDRRSKEQFPTLASSHASDQRLLSAYGDGADFAPSTSPHPGGDGRDSSPSSRSLSPQRPRTISRRSDPPEGLPDVGDLPPPVPIHTQPPRPKTMSIPGIHASHRGDVMSMGYAPPPPPPESKRVPPVAIQSVYRLWQKQPHQQEQPSLEGTSQDASNNGDQAHILPLASSSPPPSELLSTNSSGRPVPTLPPASSSPPMSEVLETSPLGRPVPPPLPPRSIIAQVLQSQSDFSKQPTDLARTVSPASQALQSIVTKDRSKRGSVDPPLKSAPPPLPERRKSLTPAAAEGLTSAGNGKASSSTLSPVMSSDITNSDRTMVGGIGVTPKAPALPPRRTHTPSS